MAYEIQKPYQERVRLFLQLPLIGLQAGFEAVFHAIGGVGGTAYGIHILVEGFVRREAVPGIIKAAFHHMLRKTRRLLVLQKHHILDASFGIQGY